MNVPRRPIMELPSPEILEGNLERNKRNTLPAEGAVITLTDKSTLRSALLCALHTKKPSAGDDKNIQLYHLNL